MVITNEMVNADPDTDNTVEFGGCDANMIADAVLIFYKHVYVRVHIADPLDFEAGIQQLRDLLVQEKETLLAQNPNVFINTDFTFEPTALWLRLADDCEWYDDANTGDTEVEILPGGECIVTLGNDRGGSLEHLTVVWEHETVAPNVVVMYLAVCNAYNYSS